ncbi:venom allergen 5-like [Odontomachus brunneus]|uniref:venom allergen 5-like n=1 Tax=Odontomachus brunneus TaxID=486640 RepID=UPI0013F272B7|nr:venom allergen 5-like [Odontomachus brunneus]XP_032679258.1 venom allergen 5-like [Odontomachus brunneus]XP_032679259.1 venom allergen 5-like [Odontomachus brunneus]XP_032679261.1 venom allergen 5-like [Odontomachus brunneus]XP_032679262.1 venom allergen 5-like [Odontomachus brunneus]XP_032679263.1 venom allergen 5-like [Odontomachus brunneus]
MSSPRAGDFRDPNKSILRAEKWRTRGDLKWSLGSNAFGRFALPFCLLSLVVPRINARPACPGMEISEDNDITCDIVRDILDTHNRIRQSIAEGSINAQPPAANMRELYWDSELASGAQDWANQCIFDHNDAKKREVARFPVGQNIGLVKSTRKNGDTAKIDFPKQIHNWFDEHNVYQFGAIDEKLLPVTGHYTQLAWATTYLIGCGYSRYKASNHTTYQLYVCHYGPTGNEIGKPPYSIGNRSCDQLLETSSAYPNICGIKDPPTSCSGNGNKEVYNNEHVVSGRRFLNNAHRKAQPENIARDDMKKQLVHYSDSTYVNYSRHEYFAQQDSIVLIFD